MFNGPGFRVISSEVPNWLARIKSELVGIRGPSKCDLPYLSPHWDSVCLLFCCRTMYIFRKASKVPCPTRSISR